MRAEFGIIAVVILNARTWIFTICVLCLNDYDALGQSGGL